MKRLLLLLPLLLLVSVRPASAQLANAQGWCEAGAQTVTTSGLVSTTQVQQSVPQCTISVSIHGGGTATIFANGASGPLSNPFNAAIGGRWIFYAANGEYDITMTCTGSCVPPNPNPFPVVYSDVFVETGGGGGSGPTLETNGTPTASQTVLNLTNGGSTTITSGAAGLVTITSPTFLSGCTVTGAVPFENGTANTLTCGGALNTPGSMVWLPNGGVNSGLNVVASAANGLASIVAGAEETITVSPPNSVVGVEGEPSITMNSPASDSTDVVGVAGTPLWNGTANNTGEIVGQEGEPGNEGSGTVTFLAGFESIPTNEGGGVVTNMYGYYAAPPNNPAGTVTTNSAFYAADQSNTGSTNYGHFAEAATAGSSPAVQYGAAEGVAPNGVTSVEELWADSTAHRWKMRFGGAGSPLNVVASGVDINTSDQVTATHLASALPVNQGGTGTTSTLTGIVRGGNPLSAAELSGDATTSASNVVTVVATHLSSALPVNQGGTAQTVASTFPSTAGAIPTLFSCAAATACANTALGNTARVIFGSCPFSSSTTCTVTAITAFTGTSSYFCVVTEASNTGVTFKVANVSATSFTITASGSNSDTVNYICTGN